MEGLDLFEQFVSAADRVWRLVERWAPLARDTVGKQLIRAADSVGANLVEGDGRYGQADAVHFFVIARASARETRYWLVRAVSRDLIPPDQGKKLIGDITSATRRLNALIRYRRSHPTPSSVREDGTAYCTDESDPFTER